MGTNDCGPVLPAPRGRSIVGAGTRLRLIGAIWLAGLLAAVACGGGSATGGDGGGAKKLKVGVVLFSAADTSSMTMVDPFVAALQKDGDTVDKVDSEGTPDKAIAAIQNFVTKKVDVIFVPVWQPNQIAAGAVAAKAAGIPIVGMGGGVGNGVEATWDNASLAGKMIAKRLVDDSGGKGQLLVVSYSPGRPCQVREAQLKDAVSATSIVLDRQELQVPDIIGSTEKLTSAWLAKHPKGSGGLMVWLCADSTVPGTLAALHSAGRNDVKIYSMGGEPPALDALKKGDLTADVFVKMDDAGKQLAKQIPTIVQNGVNAKPLEVAVDAQVLDSKNIDQFLKDHPELASK